MSDFDQSRYSPGGDIYAQVESQYGSYAANRVSIAAQTGDRTAVTEEIVKIKYGTKLNDSTASNFFEQVTTDPLGAPADKLNDLIKRSVGDLFGNPFVLALVVLVLVVVFWPSLSKLIQGRR